MTVCIDSSWAVQSKAEDTKCLTSTNTDEPAANGTPAIPTSDGKPNSRIVIGLNSAVTAWNTATSVSGQKAPYNFIVTTDCSNADLVVKRSTSAATIGGCAQTQLSQASSINMLLSDCEAAASANGIEAAFEHELGHYIGLADDTQDCDSAMLGYQIDSVCAPQNVSSLGIQFPPPIASNDVVDANHFKTNDGSCQTPLLSAAASEGASDPSAPEDFSGDLCFDGTPPCPQAACMANGYWNVTACENITVTVSKVTVKIIYNGSTLNNASVTTSDGTTYTVDDGSTDAGDADADDNTGDAQDTEDSCDYYTDPCCVGA